MSWGNFDFEWIGDPIPCIYQTFETGKYTFYESFRKGECTYKIGDFVKVKSRINERLEEICKLRCVYESKEERHQSHPLKGFIQPYRFAKELRSILRIMDVEFIEENELIEDYQSVNIIINLESIKSKCNIEFYNYPCNMNTKKDITCNYFCRFKYENGEILPIFNEEAKNHSDVESEIISSSDESDDDIIEIIDESNKAIVTNKECENEDKTPNSKKGIKRLQLSSEESSPEESDDEPRQMNSNKNSVRKNLCNSFESNGDCSTNINYSIIENSPEDKPLKVKLRISRRQTGSPRKRNCLDVQLNDSTLVISSPTLDILNESMKDNALSPLVVIEKTDQKTIADNGRNLRTKTLNARGTTPLSARRSNRVTQRVSYADYLSPIKCSPLKRSRLKSENNEPDVSLYSPPKKEKENVNIANILVETNVSNESAKIETPKKRNTRGSKYYYFISDTDSEDDASEVIVTGKRQIKTPKHLRDEYESPRKTLKFETPKTNKNIESTPKSRLKSKLVENTHQTTPSKTPSRIKQFQTPRNEKHGDNTPKSRLKSKLGENTPKKTPSGRLKLLRSGTLTPSLQGRDKAVSFCDSPLMRARTQLHVSFVPKALPCREKEYQNIYVFLKDKLFDGCGGCMYVSGVPGTGKTATVTSVIQNLLEDSKAENVPEFRYISINGMKLTEPRQAYVEIMRQLTDKTVPWEQAQNMLEDKFTKVKKKERVPIIMLVDELDILCTKRQDVVYNLLDWPTKAKTQLIVITIANTMDLPERLLMNRVTSRLGLTRLTFQAYTHKQLQEIVTKRLTGTDSFNPDAIQLVARKVASVSGDARRALDICRRAAEIAELEGPDTYVSLKHVNEALNAMITQPKVQAIKRCSRLEQLILQAVVAENERTGVEETVFSDVYNMLTSVSTLDGFRTVSTKLVLAAVSRLNACRLLITDLKCSSINQRIILNVSNDDVFYALRKD